MKKNLLLAFQIIALGAYAQFTPNNLAVSRISSPTAITNVGKGFQTNIVEFSTTGVATATNIDLTGSGTDFVIEERAITHEGQLNLSADKRYLVMAGYNNVVDYPVTAVAPATGLRTFAKIIARVDATGAIDMSTQLASSGTAPFNGQSVRSVTTLDGGEYFINSGNQGTNHGTRRVFHGSEESTLYNNTGTSAHRSILAFGDRVLATTQGSSKVYSINDAGASTEIPFEVQDGYHDYVQIVVFDVDPDVSWDGTGLDLMYIADRNNGLRKFYFNGTLWTPVSAGGLYNTPSLPTTGVWALTGRLEEGKPTLYGVKILTAGGAYTASSLVKVVDNSQRTQDWNTIEGFMPTATELAITGNTEMFRGVAFTPGSNVEILPITLQSFTGNLVKENVSLAWASLSEVNGKEFQVERSNNSIRFNTIGKVSARDNGLANQYFYVDINAPFGKNYYRLKLVDKDGSYNYSKVILVNKEKEIIGLSVFPNPVAEVLNVTYPSYNKKSILRVVDISGKVLLEQALPANTTQANIPISSLGKGYYSVTITSGNDRHVSKFLK